MNIRTEAVKELFGKYRKSVLFAGAAALAIGSVAVASIDDGVSADGRSDRFRNLPDREIDLGTGEIFSKRNVLVYDVFSRPGDLAGRLPITTPDGEVWQVELGDWLIKRGGLSENSEEDWTIASDKRAYVNAKQSDVQVNAEIKHGGDAQFVGVVARYEGPVDWLMFWFDGHHDLVLGAKRTESGQDFWDLSRVPFEWESGDKHELSLRVRDNTVTAYVDGEAVIELLDVEVAGDATYAGIYSRGKGEAIFKKFTVTGQLRVDRVKDFKRKDFGDRDYEVDLSKFKREGKDYRGNSKFDADKIRNAAADRLEDAKDKRTERDDDDRNERDEREDNDDKNNRSEVKVNVKFAGVFGKVNNRR